MPRACGSTRSCPATRSRSTLAEELERLAPFGQGNPPVSLLVPAAHARRPARDGRRAATSRFTLARRRRPLALRAFGAGGTLPAEPDEPVDAAVRLEVNRWNGAVEPRLVLATPSPRRPGPIEVIGEPEFAAGAAGASSRRDLDARGRGAPRARRVAARDLRGHRDRRRCSPTSSPRGEPVLAVAAHAPHRARALADRVGGFALCSWAALEDDPELAAPFAHVVAVDPPHPRRDCSTIRPATGWTHLAWGDA